MALPENYLKIKFLFVILILSIFHSCIPDHKYSVGTFPANPVNLGDINSVYDDYNSSSPILGDMSPLVFSSNRLSYGKNFNIIYKLLDVIMTRKDGKLFVGEETSTSLDVYTANANILTAVASINNGFDELGPYLIPQGDRFRKSGTGYRSFQNYILAYSSNESGNFDIKFTQNLTSDVYSYPKNISFLNSDKDDLYPVFTTDSSKVYFCSNRDGKFDIYKTDLNKKTNLLNALSDTSSRTITKDLELSSAYDDKCPFILGNLLVFASNRPGGYGGFDLYYSVYNDSNWSSPVNMGDKINTQYDEYRPIVKEYSFEFTNNFMLFSSNRPGGKGGFDLYYVGIDK